MATLEKTKHYGLQERTETLMDVSRSKLNGPTPHQAPQRERVSLSALPNSVAEKRVARRKKQKKWKETLRPDYNMGVPQLMMILEPNIVWDHVHAFNSVLSREVEAQYCPGDFFEGWHRAGRQAHGVYEGSYWELLGDCGELEAMLRKMAEAPPLMEEPTLNLPEEAELPEWNDFKPILHALPASPTLPVLKLPPFRAPILETEVPFLEPEFEQLPEVPDAPVEEPLPIFFPPEELQAEDFVEPEFYAPEPPVIPVAPTAPKFGKPEFGHDWTGTKPFTVSLQPYQPPKLLDVPSWTHPPRQPPLPPLPVLDNCALEQADLDLEPIPRLELAWEAGPEPEPAYASVATTPLTMSRAPSPPRSVPSSVPSSRPVSAAPSYRPPTPPPTRPESAMKAPSPVPSVVPQEPSPPPQEASQREPSRSPSPPPAPSAPRQPSQPPSAVSSRASTPPRRQDSTPPAIPSYPSSVDSGKPRVWMNFEAPFAELPPIFLPPEPELGVSNGPEPQPEDFVVDSGDMEPLPEFSLPEEQPLPQWHPPVLKVPQWCPPCEPGPIGFMRGTAPVLILDVSGTMNPRQRGKFPTMKECACELLHPQGELATAAGAFDVINFCNAAWAWSATYSQRLSLLASAQVFYSGRQVGGKIVPGSAVARKTKQGAVMMPTEPDLLEDARSWVDKWPDAVGHTSMLSAVLMADEHWNADCWYVFSDGLADDPQQCIDFIEARIRHQQRVPVIHTVGFFPDDAPENFEGRRYLQHLSAMTGGTYQEYNPHVSRIYKDGVGFVPYDKKEEVEEVRVEREWAEEALRVERRKNIRLGIAERLDVTLARVQALHHQTRVQPLVKEHQEKLSVEQAQYEAEVAKVVERNNQRKAQAQAQYQQVVDEITARNQHKVDGGRGAYEAAHRAWMDLYEQQVRDWNELKAQKEAERDAALKERAEAIERYMALQSARSRTPSPPLSRPTSATPPHFVATASRPVSATARPLSASSRPPPAPSSRPTSATPARPRPSPPTPAAMPPPAGPEPTHDSPKVMAAFAQAASAAWGMAPAATNSSAASEGVVAAFASGNPHSPTASQPAGRISSPTAVASLQALTATSEPSQAQTAPVAQGAPSSGSRPTSARPLSASQRGRRSSVGAQQVGVNSQAVASQLQQLLEEGEDEEVSVEGQPSQLSDTSDLPMAAGKARATQQEEAYDSFDPDGLLGELPALELEDSQELKRRIFPPEVVQALDDSNAARLTEIRTQWASLLKEVEDRNRLKLAALAAHQDKLDAYHESVIEVYAQSFVQDVVYGAAVRMAINDRLIKAAEAAYAQEVARVEAENQRLARMHTQEVEDKIFKEERFRQAMQRWERDKASAWQQHEVDVVEAKRTHEDNIVKLKQEWEAKKEEIKQVNEVRLREAQAHHARMVEEVAATNRKYRAEHAEKVKARKAVEAENLARLAEAKLQHSKQLEALAADNEQKLRQAQEDHEALCYRLEVEHQEAVALAHKEFEELKAFLTSHNDSMLEEARKRFGEAVQLARAEHEQRCAQLRATYEEEMATVRAHNEAIWPQVMMARIAQAELNRVMAFAEHIRFCANKLQLGVNFMPNTPNYDRVVEMQALNEALIRAFPEYAPQEYPWPGHEALDRTGTGWVPSPQPMVLDLKDPAIEVNRIVATMGIHSKSRPTSAARARPVSAKPANAAASDPPTPGPATPLTRPPSGSRARFSGIKPASPLARGTAAGTMDTTGSDLLDSPVASATRLVYPAAGGYSVGGVEGIEVGDSSRPSTASPSPAAHPRAVAHPAATAPVSLAASPRPTPVAGVRGARGGQVRALSAGPVVGSTGTLPASAPSMADASNWPAVSTALQKSSSPGSRHTQSRPASARPSVPARMSAHLEAMQAAISKFRSPKMFSAPRVQDRGLLGGSGVKPAGGVVDMKVALPRQFRTDFARVEYPAVDVKALDA